MILSKVKRTIENHGMIVPGDRVGVALSGGADSVVLLSLLLDLALPLEFSVVIIHVNHGLRGAESERDAAFVEELGRKLSIPVETGRIPPAAVAAKKGRASLEDRARTERYRIFEEIRKKRQLSKIALGHTLDDQAETILMKFLRGAGLAGLRGMLPVRGGLYIRPLLETSREEVLACLRIRGLSCVADSSNSDEQFLRNRIRLTLLPELEVSCNPNLRDTLVRMAVIIRDEEDFLDARAEECLVSLGLRFVEAPLDVKIAPLRGLHRALQRRLVRKCLESMSAAGHERGFDHVEAVLSLMEGVNPSGMAALGDGLIARREYDRIIFEKPDSGKPGVRMEALRQKVIFSRRVNIPGLTPINEISSVLSINIVKAEDVDFSGPGTAFMDADAFDGPLTVRSTRPGDRIQPLGMDGHKKLKSLFIDEKVPRNLRSGIPVLSDSRSVIWVPGICLSERVKVLTRTRRIVRAELV
ncbi:MAG: tRNA lysidine(34) synthetase TilS [Syntrophales bacterium]|nr:tRNA lysidine(34) synthetase TilS [Syntrophales bacterium]